MENEVLIRRHQHVQINHDYQSHFIRLFNCLLWPFLKWRDLGMFSREPLCTAEPVASPKESPRWRKWNLWPLKSPSITTPLAAISWFDWPVLTENFSARTSRWPHSSYFGLISPIGWFLFMRSGRIWLCKLYSRPALLAIHCKDINRGIYNHES